MEGSTLVGQKCKHCKQWKPLTEYPTGERKGGTYTAQACRPCLDARNSKTKQWRLDDHRSYLLAGAKSRAKRHGLLFNITLEDVVIPETCPVLGIPLFRGGGARTDNSPTLDKVDPEGGYVRGNVAVISWRANRLKSNATPDELEKINRFVQEWITTHQTNS